MDYQHKFRKGRSCETNNDGGHAKQMDDGMQTDVIILDFSKAFDTVPHQRLLAKLIHYGIRGNIKVWIKPRTSEVRASEGF